MVREQGTLVTTSQLLNGHTNTKATIMRDDDYQDFCFDGQHLDGVVLSGRFTNVSFRSASLRGAHLVGTFTTVDFSGADLRDAMFSGRFVDVQMAGAILSDEQLPA